MRINPPLHVQSRLAMKGKKVVPPPGTWGLICLVKTLSFHLTSWLLSIMGQIQWFFFFFLNCSAHKTHAGGPWKQWIDIGVKNPGIQHVFLFYGCDFVFARTMDTRYTNVNIFSSHSPSPSQSPPRFLSLWPCVWTTQCLQDTLNTLELGAGAWCSLSKTSDPIRCDPATNAGQVVAFWPATVAGMVCSSRRTNGMSCQNNASFVVDLPARLMPAETFVGRFHTSRIFGTLPEDI